MANIFLKDPIYISVDDVKDSTGVNAISLLTDDEIKVLIRKAQREIDKYLGATFRPPFDESQDLLFPVCINNTSVIPAKITEACLYCVEKIYTVGTLPSSTTGGIKKESVGPHSVEYFDSADTDGDYIIDDFVKVILNEYKNVFRTPYL